MQRAPTLHAMRAIVVLGMHRSGTSALTRALGAMGAALGPRSQLRQNAENVALRAINERLLDVGAGTWDAPPARGWLESPAAGAHAGPARATLHAQFGAAEVIAWKDPRTCVTLPFWLDILGDGAVFVLIHRHPGEVARSLAARSSLGRGHSYALWERYTADALTTLVGRPTYVQAYSRLVSAPVDSLVQLRGALAGFGVALRNDPRTVEHGLSSAERHHAAAVEDAVDADVATAAQRELFTLVRDLEGPHDALPQLDPPAPHPLSLEVLDLARRLRTGRRLRRQARTARPATGSSTHIAADKSAAGL